MPTPLTLTDLLTWLVATQNRYGSDLPIWLRSTWRGYTGTDDAPLDALLLTEDLADDTHAVVLASAVSAPDAGGGTPTVAWYRYALGAQVRLVGLPYVYTITFRRVTEGDMWPFAEYLVHRPEDVQRPPQWVYESECLPVQGEHGERMKDEG